MVASLETALGTSPLFSRLSRPDRQRLSELTRLRSYRKGERVFSEGDPSDFIVTVVSGRVKVIKLLPSGREVILEIFGPGDPVGAVAAYEDRPYPASAVTLEDSACLLIRSGAFFAMLEQQPRVVRALLGGLSHRLVELTNRISELTGSRVEQRFAHLFLKLADRMGRPVPEGTLIPIALSRQDLADLTGTTIETAIRLMSRWGKLGVVVTQRDGFVLSSPKVLEELALS